jgi:TonB family protein
VTRATPNEPADAVIRVCADAAGRPYDISVQRSTGDTDLDRAVIQAAKSWSYLGTDGDRPQGCDNVSVRVNGAGM